MVIKKLLRFRDSLAIILPAEARKELRAAAGTYVVIRVDHHGNVILTNLEDHFARVTRDQAAAARRD